MMLLSHYTMEFSLFYLDLGHINCGMNGLEPAGGSHLRLLGSVLMMRAARSGCGEVAELGDKK